MEYLDVLDKDGNHTGEKKPKPDIHRDGDWHKAAHIWVVDPMGNLLIQKHSSRARGYPDMWDISSAGHISAGEDSLTAALREVKEELSLEIKPEDLEYLFSVAQQAIFEDGAYINNEFKDVYLVELDHPPSDLKLQKEEVSATRWIPYKKLEEIIKNGSSDFIPHPDEYPRLFAELYKRYS